MHGVFTVVECDIPPPVNASSLNPNKNVYVYLDTLTYTCDLGYNLTSGNDVRTCTETGEWNGTAPNCTCVYIKLFGYIHIVEILNFDLNMPYETSGKVAYLNITYMYFYTLVHKLH